MLKQMQSNIIHKLSFCQKEKEKDTMHKRHFRKIGIV